MAFVILIALAILLVFAAILRLGVDSRDGNDWKKSTDTRDPDDRSGYVAVLGEAGSRVALASPAHALPRR